MTDDDLRRLRWCPPEEKRFRTREELDREFERPDSKLTLEQYRAAHDALPWRSEKPSALGISAKRPPAPKRPAPAARSTGDSFSMANVDGPRFVDGLLDYLAKALQPLADRIKQLEQSSAVKLAVHRMERQGEHIRRLETRVAALERNLKEQDR